MNTILLFGLLLFGSFLRGRDAKSVSYNGEVTTASPKWTRPTACDCATVLVGDELFVGFTVESFNILTTGLFDVMITVDSQQNSFNGLNLVYQDDFDPMFPLDNLLGCNDDDGQFLSSVTLNLQCGTQYFVVTTSFSATMSPTGTFTNTISGHAGGEPVLGPLDDSDTDGDGVTDACDDDVDGDGIDNGMDNCPMDVNANQEDSDGDGDSDVCDPDVDGDGIDNGMDKCLLTPLTERPVSRKGEYARLACPYIRVNGGYVSLSTLVHYICVDHSQFCVDANTPPDQPTSFDPLFIINCPSPWQLPWRLSCKGSLPCP